MLSCFSRVSFFMNLWTAAHQTSLFMGLFQQEYWSGLPCLPPGDLLNPAIEPESPISPALAGGFFFLTTTGAWEAPTFNKWLRCYFLYLSKRVAIQ